MLGLPMARAFTDAIAGFHIPDGEVPRPELRVRHLPDSDHLTTVSVQSRVSLNVTDGVGGVVCVVCVHVKTNATI